MKRLIRGFFCFSAFIMLLTGCAKTSSGTGTLRVGVRDDIVGFGYFNATTKQYYGMEIDLARELAKELGYANASFVSVEPENRKAMVQNGEVDCLLAMYSIEDSRLENLDFSPAYFTDNTCIMVEESSLIDEVEDLVGKNIGVLQGANAAPKLADYMKAQGLIREDCLYNTSLTYRDTYDELSVALEEGVVDAICADGGILQAYGKEDRIILDNTIGTESYGVATKKDSQLSQLVSQAIQKMLDDGRIDEMADKWGLGDFRR